MLVQILGLFGDILAVDCIAEGVAILMLCIVIKYVCKLTGVLS